MWANSKCEEVPTEVIYIIEKVGQISTKLGRVIMVVSLVDEDGTSFKTFSAGCLKNDLVHVPNFGGHQGWRTGVRVTTVSNSLILGGWVTKVLRNGNEK